MLEPGDEGEDRRRERPIDARDHGAEPAALERDEGLASRDERSAPGGEEACASALEPEAPEPRDDKLVTMAAANGGPRGWKPEVSRARLGPWGRAWSISAASSSRPHSATRPRERASTRRRRSRLSTSTSRRPARRASK
jgi:hypothetical protein